MWEDVEDHVFTPRAPWQGAEEPELGELFDGLDATSEPLDFFERTDAPDREYHERAMNSEKRAAS